MKKKMTVVLIILALVAAGLIARSVKTYYQNRNAKEAIVAEYDTELERVSYDASKEIEAAKKKFDEIDEGAKIIRDRSTQEARSAALVFQGVQDRATVEQILKILQKYDCKATFCVGGNVASEDSDLLQLIDSEGFTLADNALNGETFMEELDSDELITNFATSHKILSTLTNDSPNIMMCNSTFYADTVARAAKACGYDKLIAASAGKFINKNSFKDFKNTCEYTDKLKGGNILVIKLNGPLTPLEYEANNAVIDPAKDKKPTEATQKQEEEEKEESDILTTVDWLCRALRQSEVKTVSITNMKAQSDEEYIKELIQAGEGVSYETVTGIKTIEDSVSLVYKGIPNEETTEALIELLQGHEAEAVFFAKASDVTSNPESVRLLSDAGFKIGSMGFDGTDMSSLEPLDIYRQFSLFERKLLEQEGRLCRYYYPPANRVSEKVKSVAGALGYTVVIPDKRYFGVTAEALENGRIYRIDCADEGLMSDTQKLLAAADNMGKSVVDIPKIIASGKARPVIEDEVVAKLREENGGKQAAVHDTVYTTEKAFSFLFYGISNRATLKDVLKNLDSKGYKATFFANYSEFEECEDAVRSILDAGHEIGIAYIESEACPQEFDSVARYLLGISQYTEWKYDLKPVSVMMPYGEINKETREAISACGMECVGKEISLVQTKYVDAEDVNEFYGSLAGKINLHRGSLVYIHMNAFSADIEQEADEDGEVKTITGQLLQKFITNKVAALTYKDVYGQVISSTAYHSKAYHDLAHSSRNWSPGGGGGEISADKNLLTNTVGYKDSFNYMKARYVGNYNASGEENLPGFDFIERYMLDKSGRITNNKVLFLTFDDWGTDYSVNQLLYVLNKYNVKATFFFVTQNVPNNPNLLRAVAEEGHEIASHTDTHMVLSNEIIADNVNKKYLYGEITPEQALKLREDLARNYSVLHRYTGDVTVNGKRALSLNFRPPTLAVSKLGLYQVFDVGYHYSIMGDFSTNDYAATSMDELVNLFANGRSTWEGQKTIGPGSVIVMHMSENAQYTAEALDIMIPKWQQMGYSFARIDDYLK